MTRIKAQPLRAAGRALQRALSGWFSFDGITQVEGGEECGSRRVERIFVGLRTAEALRALHYIVPPAAILGQLYKTEGSVLVARGNFQVFFRFSTLGKSKFF